jgi:hypothetical protein
MQRPRGAQCRLGKRCSSTCSAQTPGAAQHPRPRSSCPPWQGVGSIGSARAFPGASTRFPRPDMHQRQALACESGRRMRQNRPCFGVARSRSRKTRFAAAAALRAARAQVLLRAGRSSNPSINHCRAADHASAGGAIRRRHAQLDCGVPDIRDIKERALAARRSEPCSSPIPGLTRRGLPTHEGGWRASPPGPAFGDQRAPGAVRLKTISTVDGGPAGLRLPRRAGRSLRRARFASRRERRCPYR